MSGRIGRPPAEDPLSRKVTLRLTQSEYEAVAEAAARYDMTISEWVRARLVAAAKRAQR